MRQPAVREQCPECKRSWAIAVYDVKGQLRAPVEINCDDADCPSHHVKPSASGRLGVP